MSPPALPNRVAVLVSCRDGTVLEQNDAARSLLGRVVGSRCDALLPERSTTEHLPCTHDCVAQRLREGSDGLCAHRVAIDGVHYTLSCLPAHEHVLVTLTPTHERPAAWEQLTPREQVVLRGVADGLTTGQLAERLSIAPSTVRAHVEHMRVKLDVGTRAALVARGFALGYLP